MVKIPQPVYGVTADGRFVIADPVEGLFPEGLEEKFNPYHDELGRFTFSPAGGAAFASAQAKITAEIDAVTKQYATAYKDYFRTDDDAKAVQMWQQLDDLDTLRNKLIAQRERGKANIMQLAVRNIAKEDKAMAGRIQDTMRQLAGGGPEGLFQGAF